MLTDVAIETYSSEPNHRLYEVVATSEGVRLAPTCERGHQMVMEVLQRFGLVGAQQQQPIPVRSTPVPAPPPAPSPVATPPVPSEGNRYAPAPAPQDIPADVAPTPAAPLTLSRLMDIHVKNMTRGTDVKNSAIRERRYILDLFLQVVGDKTMAEITHDDAAAFADVLAVWPAYRHNYPDFKHMTAKAVAAKAKRENYRPIHRDTQAKHIKAMKAFFHACVKNGSIGQDPFRLIEMSRYRDTIPRKKEVFSQQDLEALFNPDLMRTYTEPHKFWVPLIALHTGMRVNEICQLYLEDILLEEVSDETGQKHRLLCLDITPYRKGQRVKTPHSRRRVPVHSKLLDLGFAQYVEDVRASGAKHLFPGLTWSWDGPGRTMTRWFNGPHLRKVCNIASRAKTLHCFRHTITTLADRAWVPPSIMRTINGHSDGRDVENQSYVARGTLMECKRALEKLPFPDLPLEPYVPERFAGYLKHAAEEEGHRERLEAAGKIAQRRKGRPPTTRFSVPSKAPHHEAHQVHDVPAPSAEC